MSSRKMLLFESNFNTYNYINITRTNSFNSLEKI